MGNFNLFVTCVLFAGYITGGASRIEAPKIEKNYSEHIISSQSDFNVSCVGKNPIIWTYPNETVDGEYFSKIVVKTAKIPQDQYPHRANLIIRNASFVDTGYYYCHEIDAEKDAKDRSSKIYIYVADKEHLSAINDVQLLSAPQYSEVIIPCRPTSPDIRVKLIDFNGEQVKHKYFDPKSGFAVFVSSLLFSGNYICEFKYNNIEEVHYKYYDPKFGFIVYVVSLKYSGTYNCEFETNDNITEAMFVHLKVISETKSIEKPFIDVSNNGKTSVGETLVLNCTLKVEPNVFFEITWDVPDKHGLEVGRIKSTKAFIDRNRNELGWSALTIHNVTLKDAGNYTCAVEDHIHNKNEISKEIIVLDRNESHINLSVIVNNITVKVGIPNVTWVIDIDAYPEVKIHWINNKGEKILPDGDTMMVPKYRVTKTPSKTTFVIFDVTLNDSGTYQLEAINEIERKTLNLTLTIEDIPRVTIISNKYHRVDEDGILQCIASGYPLPEVQWFVGRCEKNNKNNCSYTYIDKKRYLTSKRPLEINATISVKAISTGSVKCFAFNALGNGTAIKNFQITDVENGFDVWGIEDASAVASGENVTLHCGASIYDYSDTQWFIWKNNTRQTIAPDNRIQIKRTMTNYSHQISLTINSIQRNDSGDYVCVARGLHTVDGEDDYINKTIIVREPFAPKMTETNLDGSDLQVKAGEPITLNCTATGIPTPQIKWKKNDMDLEIHPNNTHITLYENNTILHFKYLVDDDNGDYSCHAENKIGSDFRKLRLMLKNSNWGKSLVITLVVLAIVFIFLCTVLVIKIRKEKKLRRELKIAGLQNFEKGALESLNPDLGVDDQAELLPYDKKWEFPRDKLKLGKQLGSGAFGVVMKADAYGLCEGEPVTTVAVKMVKRNADCTYIKALASELKIMVHLGKHLNVVNLLGACTKNVAKRELLVIVEYCRFGNLHNYLLRHRDDFINQIDPKTGTIDASIGAEYLQRTMSIASNQSGSKSPSFAGVDYRSTPLTNSCNTDSTVMCSPSGEDTMILSNNSAQPEWRSNYRGDYNKGNVKPISTHDLLCWAFQVARGMEYLASRKVLHGDLAARNILLAEENIVKICDFGLAKSMYKSDNYKKKGDGPLPVKWMAVESIRDRVFSTQSDVWSYGIVLWEFFSLARTPYPGMDADERLYNKLVDGYRMDKPEYATKDIYQIILECWDAKPVYRPSFNKLAESLGSMLQESVRQHYISLNDPYIIMNNTQMEGHSDYLAMLSPPDYGNLASPVHEYVNGLQIPEDPAAEASASGYLPMDIFSPKPSANIFNFESELPKKQKTHEETGSGTELLPILHSNVDSDSELSSPTSPTKNFANPGYNVLPLIEDKNKILEPKKDILPTSDNYINMPQQKKTLGMTDAFSNPNYIDINNKDIGVTMNENNYVNSQSRDWERI